MQTDTPRVIRPRRKSPLVRLAQSWQLYVLLLPAVAYLIIFHYIPLYGVQGNIMEDNQIEMCIRDSHLLYLRKIHPWKNERRSFRADGYAPRNQAPPQISAGAAGAVLAIVCAAAARRGLFDYLPLYSPVRLSLIHI